MEEKEIRIKIKDNSQEVQKNAEEIKKDYDAIRQSVDQLDQSLKKVERDVDSISTSSKEASGSINKIGQGIRSISSNVKTIGLGLLVTQFDSFKESLLGSSAATDFLNTSLNVTKKAAGDLVSTIMGGGLTDALKGGISSILDGTAIEKIKNYGRDSINAAKNVTDLTNKAAIASVKQQGIFELYDRQAEKQRMIRDNQLLDIETRTKASEKLKVILDAQTKEMLNQAMIQKNAKDATYALTNSREDYLATLEAENNVLGIKAQIQGFLTEQDQARIGLLQEQRQSQEALSRSAIDLEYQKMDVANQMQLQQIDILRGNKEILSQRLTDEAQYYQMIASQYEEGSTRKIEVEIEANQKLTEIRNQQKQNDYQMMLEEKAIDRARLESKMMLINQIGSSVGQLGQLFEQGTAAAKTAALAEIAINTATAYVTGLRIAQEGAKAGGPAAPFLMPIFYATQVASILSAVGKAKSILDGGSVTGGEIGSSAAQVSAPRFNVVGVSPINQAAQVMSNSANQPVKAYVVSKDITTAQELDRNKISTVGL